MNRAFDFITLLIVVASLAIMAGNAAQSCESEQCQLDKINHLR